MFKHITTIAAFLILTLSWAGAAAADTFGSVFTFDIEFVSIGKPGNPDDTTGNPNPAGSVPYVYRMGKFEVSEIMIAKANVEGGMVITNTNMIPYGGNGPNRPVTGVSWYEAARFVNWLNTSSGFAPAYKFEFQPGEAGYNVNAPNLLWDVGDAGYDPNNLFRNRQARYVLPTYDEWYKAAYFDPNANGGLGGYWNYPTGSDTAPTPVASGTTAGTAVSQQPFDQGPADVTLAGGLSPYGTMGQGGNVFELEESESDLVNDSVSSPRGQRGGFWFNGTNLASANRFGENPSDGGGGIIGFRVASVPGPGDANNDGVLNNLDIASFVLALTNPAAYAAAFPNVDPEFVLDMNNDGVFNNLDIAGFVAALVS